MKRQPAGVTVPGLDISGGGGRWRRTAALALVLAAACGGGGGDDEALTGPGERFAEPPPETTSTVATSATTAPSGAPQVLRAASVSTSAAEAPPGVDAAGRRVSYGAANLTDGHHDSAWRVPGDGRGVVISMRFDQPVTVHGLALIPGYAKIDETDGTDRFRQNRRVVRVRVAYDAAETPELRFADRPELQNHAVGPHRTSEVRIEILETTPNPSRDFTAISEIELRGFPT